MRRRWCGLLALCVVAGGCGDGATDVTSSGDAKVLAWPDRADAAPIGFAVGRVPEGYVVSLAGEGDTAAYLSDDSCGTTESALLLAPEGWDPESLEGFVAVRSVRHDGLQGGFSQASPYAAVGTTTSLEIAGDKAVYAADQEGAEYGEGWAALLVDQGGPWAIRVTGPGADLDLLRSIAEGSRVEDGLPVVDELPAGWEVVSRVHADQTSVSFGLIERDDSAPGRVAVTGRAIGYVAADTEVVPPLDVEAIDDGWHPDPGLVVASVPGSPTDALALAVLRTDIVAGFCVPAGRLESVERVEVGGAEGWLSTSHLGITLGFGSPGGPLMVVSSVGDPSLDGDDLVAVAESVEQLEPQAWEASVVELNGGPGLHPDPGQAELARGTFDGVGWLLQTGTDSMFPGYGTSFGGPGTEDIVGGTNWPIPPAAGPAACLILDSGVRQCGGMAAGAVVTYDRMSDGSEPTAVFTIGIVKPAVATVRVTRGAVVEEVATLDLPETELRLFVTGHRPGEPWPGLTYLGPDGAELDPMAAGS